MKRLITTLALMLCLGCASLPTFPPRLPDGSLDVATLIDFASGGIEADCALGFDVNVCTFGRKAVKDAKDALAADPDHPKAAVGLSLARSAVKWPVVAPYVQFVRDLLV